MEDIKKGSIKKNYLYSIFYQGLTYLTPLITIPYLSRILGPDGIGEISYIESIVAYFVLAANMGANTYGQREISYYQNDRKRRSTIFWNVKFFSLCMGSLSVFMYLLWSVISKNSLLYVIISMNIVSAIVDVTWFYKGIENFKLIVIRNSLVKIVGVVLIFCVVKDRGDLYLYALIVVMTLFVGNASLWLKLPDYIDLISISELDPFSNTKKIISLFLPEIAITMYTVLDKTMLGSITGIMTENGYYEQAMKITRMVLAIITSMGSVVMPRIGALYGQGDNETAKKLVYTNYEFVWAIGIPLCFGMIGIADSFVPWFLGIEFEKVITLLHIVPLIILFVGISNVTGWQYLVPNKKEKIVTFTVFVGAVVNFILNLFMIRLFNSVGAAIASVIAELIVSIIQLIIVRKEINTWSILKKGIPYFVAAMVMLIILRIENSFCPSNILGTLIMIVSGFLIYLILLMLFFRERILALIKGL